MRQKTLLKIIELMRKDLDKGLTILEISRRLKIGYRPAYNHITEMGKEGIIHIDKVGNAKQCLLNLSSPKARHLLESLDISRKEEIERENYSYQYSHNIKISPLIADIEEFKKMLKSRELNIGKEVKESGISLYGHEIFWRIVE